MYYFLTMDYSNDFINRHVGINKQDAKEMLEYLNEKNISALIEKTIPEKIRLKKDLDLNIGISEPRYLELIQSLGKKIRTTEVILV